MHNHPKDYQHFAAWVGVCCLLFAACSSDDRAARRGAGSGSGSGAGAGASAGTLSPTTGRGAGAPASAYGQGGSTSGRGGTHASAPAGVTLVISPDATTQTLDGSDLKPIAFTAKLSNGEDSAVGVRWTSDVREVGTVDANTGVFTPTGAGGTTTIIATAGSLKAVLKVSIVVKLKQDGDPDMGSTPAGSGGLGGVGGEGSGTVIEDQAVRAALDADPMDDAELKWLYPYDGTVWPRGLPAPLLQWQHGTHAAVAVKLHIEVDTSYTADLYLGRPAALAADKPIQRIPIPGSVWRNSLLSGKQMKVTLTIVASDGTGGYQAYRAPSVQTWSIAPTTLRGTVYYNSYGTRLAENFNGGVGGNGRFGGATLAITKDSYDPKLVAGSTTVDSSGCRVCHTVSADGSLLIVQHDDYVGSSAYDLRNKNQERAYSATDNGKFAWAGLSADGTLALGNAGPPGNSPGASLAVTSLYKTSDASVLMAQGLSEFVAQAATPAFSLDSKKVAFNLFSGPGTSSIPADGRSLVMMDFDRSNNEFSHPKSLFTATVAGQRPGWPAFLPDGTGMVFELEVQPGTHDDESLTTRWDARGELWWTDLEGHAHALDRANGKGYLPTAENQHDADTTLQYEPTVAPIVAGGYAWVVFTSRRLYGNVATREPFQSDPRGWDLNAGNALGPTTKKLWVTALDIPAKADSDPSHPAFYLPAQELFAGNSRGFWALDACKPSNAECMGGDECCGGYCQIDPEFGVGSCTDRPPSTCAREYDRCNVDADCCASTTTPLACLGNRCARYAILQ